jgi:uncharacterized protein YceK
MKRALAAIAAGLVLSGCGALTHTAAPTSGRVAGHVTVRVCGGANTENQTGCQAHPSPGVTLAFKEAASGRLSHATTDATGGYAITLSPGSYEVTIQPGDSVGTMRRSGPPGQVTVVAGKTVAADFGYTIQLL